MNGLGGNCNGGGGVAGTWFIRVSSRSEAAVVGGVVGMIDGDMTGPVPQNSALDMS